VTAARIGVAGPIIRDSTVQPLKGLLPHELETLAVQEGGRPFAGRQMARWMYGRGVDAFDRMTDLPRPLREKLAGRYRINDGKVAAELVSADGSVKLLVELSDGARVECVSIPEGRRTTLCVSTQAGCARACAFCATGRAGFRRNLSAGEIVEQAVIARRRGPVTNVVFMGQGEPLDNYENVRRAVGLLTSPLGFGIGARHVTVSTVGVVPGVIRLGEDRVRAGLTVSLSAPDDALRARLAPVAKRWPLEELLEAVQSWRRATRRDPTIAYVILGGVNDSSDHARRLGAIARRIGAKVNLVPFNPARGFNPPAADAVNRFHAVLLGLGIVVLVRKPRGSDIAAACGQLAASEPSRAEFSSPRKLHGTRLRVPGS
jgi:23S rRNA (adenine2503-C2)-methyltransferase